MRAIERDGLFAPLSLWFAHAARMSAKKFISELDRRKILSDRLMEKLRNSVAEIRKPLSADDLANFLVQKKLLTLQQANDVLAGLTMSGVNLAQADTELPVTDEPAADDGSSVFASHIISHPLPTPPPPPEEEEELRLIPLDDDADRASSRSDVLIDEGVPMLAEVPGIEELPVLEEPPQRKRTAERLVKEPERDRALIDEDLRPGPGIAAGTAAPQAPHQKAAIRRIADKKKKGRPTKSKKTWDSPLILFGGGSLAFLILIGATIWFLMFRQTADQQLAQAREAAKSGAYPAAIQQYDEFLTGSPRHPDHSVARVELAMLRIRQAAESREYAQALTIAETELKAIEDEPAFESGQEEIAALLPQIAEGLAQQAEKAAPTSDDSKKLVELANKALELCDNAKYLPKTFRDETRLTNVREALERVARRQQSQFALADGLKGMDQALAVGKLMEAYAAHKKLLTEHPELAGEAPLAEAIKKTGEAEQAAIKFVDEAKAAETAERPTPWIAALAVANRHAGAPTAGVSGTACVRVDGAVYGLDAATGKLLWRRFVGYKQDGWPQRVGDDVLLVDSVQHELLKLEAATGKLIWRQTIGEAFANPLVTTDRAYVPADSGRLYVLDLKTGNRTGYFQLPQPLHVAPVLDRAKQHLYVVGDRASVYSITLADLKCGGVFFLGHAPGTIQVPPVVVSDKLAVIENNGVETSRLHLLTVGEKGAVAKQQTERRLTGLATSPPLVSGRSLIVITDRGQMEVYDVAAGNEGETFTVVATRDAVGTQPLTRHAVLLGRNVWVADTQLTKYNIVPTGNRLPVEEIENTFAGATFDHPIAAYGSAIVEVHRPKGRAGAVVAGLESKRGQLLWETELAMPPAGAPVVDDAAKAITVANAVGYAFRFDEAAIRSRVQDQPLAAKLAPPQPPTLNTAVDLGQGRALFCAPGSDWLLLYNPAQANLAQWLHLDSTLACAPTMLGPGFLAPLTVGQVFYLSAGDGTRLAAPFQPRVEAQTALAYKTPAAVGTDGRQFVITDGGNKLYLVQLVDQPQPHWEAAKQGDVGPRPISSALFVLGDTLLGIASDSRLLRFKLPSLESAGESALPAPLEWGPFAAADTLVVGTADQKLLVLQASGEPRWQVPIEHGPLAGAPLVRPDSIVLAYRNGTLERRALADGKVLGTANLEQPVATGPVAFLQKLVVAANDGTIIVADQP